MAGNTFGQLFRVTTFGESHGPALGAVVDGVVPGIPLTEKDIQIELDRRRPGQSNVTTPRREDDTVEILSGVFEGKTTGAPIALLIRNRDQKSSDYDALRDIFRPGHADFTYLAKYGIRDHRGGGRASGRETAGRVAAGAVAKKILKTFGIRVYAYTQAIGKVTAQSVDLEVIDKNPVRAPDLKSAELMILEIERVRGAGDSIGGIIEAVVKGCPPGLGDPVFEKLNAIIGHGLLSIGAVRGVEFGAGFAAAQMKGSEHNDNFSVEDKKITSATNNAGGILGGISTGADIVLRVAVKPTSSIASEQKTVTIDQKPTTVTVTGRHDPCLCPRLVVVVEAMLAMSILDALLIQKGLCPNE